VYWIAAVVLVIVTVRRVPVSSQQLVTMAAIGVPILLVLQRALGASSLRRVLREALRGE
jgi:phosphate/sulfate permease